MMRRTVWCAVFGLPALAVAQPILPGDILRASDAAQGDSLGFSVAIDGDTAVAGAHLNDDLGESAGSAYIYERGETGWVEVAKLYAPDGEAGDDLGYSVAIQGDLVLLGARFADAPGVEDTGGVYVYGRDVGGADAWGFLQKLTPSDPVISQRFGVDVAICGNTIGVGSTFAVGGGVNSGAVYLFDRPDSASPFSERQKIFAPDTTTSDQFGRAVEIEGDLLIVGAPQEDELAVDTGAGYIYEREAGGLWVLRDKLIPSDAADNLRYGYAGAIEGSTVVFTARRTTLNGIDSGTVYIYEETSPGSRDWEEATLLVAPDAMGDIYFGEEVQLDSDNLLVGASHIENRTGAAYVFTRDAGIPGGWAYIQRLGVENPTIVDFFGVGVDLSGDIGIVGSFGFDTVCPGEPQGCNDGAAFIFTGFSSLSAQCVGDCDASGGVDFNDLVAMLFEFGVPSPSASCDCDNSSVVDFNDLVCALFAFGPCP